jgi:predicted Mrr-cat superfamily restriction endonuclease
MGTRQDMVRAVATAPSDLTRYMAATLNPMLTATYSAGSRGAPELQRTASSEQHRTRIQRQQAAAGSQVWLKGRGYLWRFAVTNEQGDMPGCSCADGSPADP